MFTIILAFIALSAFAVYQWRMPKLTADIESFIRSHQSGIEGRIHSICEIIDNVDVERIDQDAAVQKDFEAMLGYQYEELMYVRELYIMGDRVYENEDLIKRLGRLTDAIHNPITPYSAFVESLKENAAALRATVPSA